MILLTLWLLLRIMVIGPDVVPAAQTGTRATGAVVRVTVKPDIAYVERSETGQHLNCDFLLENLTNEELLLTGVELSVFDDSGRLARRDFVNRFSRTSLELPPRLVLRAKQRILVFNPFHSFATSVPLKKLRYEFAFGTDDGSVRHTSVAEVVPILYETKTALVLPVKGRVLVWDGHDYHSHHRRMDYTLPVFKSRRMTTNFHRYGYDFVIVNQQGVMYRGAPKQSDDWYRGQPDDNKAYFAFGQPVYAAGAGRVADVHDGEADNRRVNPIDFTKRETAVGGNYVVIDHLNGEFSWFGHMKQGSIKVRRGQSVRQGDILGLIGASGDSLFPHLHYELRTGPGITGVEGLPSYFGGFRRVFGSQRRVERGQLDTGDIVENP
jgi:Peptidase family M23